MTNKALSEVIERAKSWPHEAQEELAAIARDLDAGLRGDVYYPSEEEIAGIERGLRAAEEGRFATEEEVEAVFSKYRR
jgi:predicted transcriptional regulator